MAINLRTIDLNMQFKDAPLFPIDKTLIGFLQIKLKSQRKGLMDTLIEDLKTRFPKAVQAIESKSSDEEIAGDLKKVRGGTLATDALLTKCFNYFNIETDILSEAKPATVDKINELSVSKEGDSDTIKLLKEVVKEQAETYKAIFESWELGVSGLIFTADSIKQFYLDYLPNTYIKEHLEKEPVIKISDLDQVQVKQLLSDIFATLYSGYTQLEQESDLEGFKGSINDGLSKLKKLIEDTRINKKPQEPEKPTENVEDLKKEIAKWVSAFPIADYPNGAESVKELITKLQNQKPSEGGSSTELNNWLKEFPVDKYPKGAEDVKGEMKLNGDKLQQYQDYFKEVIKGFEEQQNYVLEEETTNVKN